MQIVYIIGKKIGENFQFQNVLGALDGIHIPTNVPKHLQHAYIYGKKFYSVVIMACYKGIVQLQQDSRRKSREINLLSSMHTQYPPFL